MANLVITSNSIFVKIEFNDQMNGMVKIFSKHLIECGGYFGDESVMVQTGGVRDRENYAFSKLSGQSVNNVTVYQVDTINGVTPTDRSHLMDLIFAL